MASLTSQVSSSASDAQELSSGTVDTSGGALNASTANQYIGLAFDSGSFSNLKGAVVTSAYLEAYLTSSDNDTPNITIYGEDTDYASSFAGATNEISNRPRTIAGITWSASKIGTGWKTSPDIAAAIQEVIDRPGWESSLGLGLIIKGNSGSSYFRIRSYDGNSSQAAKLTINYEPAGQPAIARGRLVPGMRRPHGSQGW